MDVIAVSCGVALGGADLICAQWSWPSKATSHKVTGRVEAVAAKQPPNDTPGITVPTYLGDIFRWWVLG